MKTGARRCPPIRVPLATLGARRKDMRTVIERPATPVRNWHKTYSVVCAVLSPMARPLRVTFTGGIAALVQLLVLDALTDHHWSPVLADALALAVGAQVNFCLSYIYTWHDRRPVRRNPRVLVRRWGLYQAAAATTAVLNLFVFDATRHELPIWLAALVGTIVAAAALFALNDRIVFRRE